MRWTFRLPAEQSCVLNRPIRPAAAARGPGANENAVQKLS